MTPQEKTAKRLEARFKQSIENKQIRQVASEVLDDLNDKLVGHNIVIYHVSHQLAKAGIVHHRMYDKKRFNGLTIAFVVPPNYDGATQIYASFCDTEDTYSRSFGRLKVLTRIQKHLEETEKGNPDSKYKPVLLDSTATARYLKLEQLVDEKKITRAAIDWYITNHVNRPKKTKKVVEFTRQQVLEAEAALARKAEDELNNIVDLRVVYDHTEPEGNGLPAVLRRLENPNSNKVIRETTTARLELAATERNKELPSEVVESVKEVLNTVKAKVHRYVNDKPNRVNARMFAIRKLTKTHF